ncbi:RHS domain-containing protein [Klebsiella aerogenes]|uniref:RHS domain-containing protein n=1 Tax=Klebsiella aerogenes TaxID=548 RepID=UPI00398410F5
MNVRVGNAPPASSSGGSWQEGQKVRTYWYQNGHLGTPHSLTDSLGEVVYSCSYNAYGQVREETHHQQAKRGYG